MAWTAPMTFVVNTALTAAQLNTYLRDNLLETEAAKAKTPGSMMVSTAANACAERLPKQQSNTAIGTRATNSYGDLTVTADTIDPGVGPQVSATTGDTAMVIWNVQIYNRTSSAFARCSVDVAGGTNRAASDSWAVTYQKNNPAGTAVNTFEQLMQAHVFKNASSLTAGTNVFKILYKADTGTGVFQVRRLIVIPF